MNRKNDRADEETLHYMLGSHQFADEETATPHTQQRKKKYPSLTSSPAHLHLQLHTSQYHVL